MATIEGLLEAAKASSLQCLDLSGVTITLRVADTVAAMKETHPQLTITHGGTGGYLRPKPQLKPVEKLVKYARDNNLVLLDLFRSFDKEQHNHLSEEEFRNALKVRTRYTFPCALSHTTRTHSLTRSTSPLLTAYQCPTKGVRKVETHQAVL